ncbi:E3 ubiquitin-protein ligase TRIM56-like [Podarcis raffonei]|uniref:E3 ubiquitin-protein ligase TRIM56-like n=1 Tax=Podarcis raffonei TaxID=65483 RepID=UPI0023296727|nr:E3 ubiquitin-protein ligase TRIM56-like [Podarcis raffonei]XP_053218582.1 E3 ubiquitin-protein ligase TRIM56-like [Podarcis raffonei]XP_053218583.1 E3 ubiquitin-protein ligase TRIM56-like [Podarcis raffonei]
MAAKAPSLSEALTSGFLTCTICLERLRRPKILPCLHSYCQECLRKLAGGRKELQCPECRERVALPEGGVGALRTNFFINGLLDLVRPTGEAEPTCSLCPLIGQETSQPAVSHCLDCADDMCQDCASGHRCSRLTHLHRVVAMKDYLSGEHDEEIRKRQALQCKEHTGEELRFFCTPCAVVLCRECRLGAHLQHPCLPLAEAAQARRPVIVELLAGVEETVQVIRTGRASLEREAARLQVREASIRDAVEQACSRAVQRLLAQQEEVLAQLADYVKERQKACQALCSDLEFQEQVASSTVAFAQKVLSLGREVEIVSLEQVICERLRHLQGFSWEPLATRLPCLEVDAEIEGSGPRLFHLEFREESPTGVPESPQEAATKGAKKKTHLPEGPQEEATKGAKKETHLPEGPQEEATKGAKKETHLPCLEVNAEIPTGVPEGHKKAATKGAKKKRRKQQQQVPPVKEGFHMTTLILRGCQQAVAPVPPPKVPGTPLLTPKPLFSCSFCVKSPSDQKCPLVTGLCPFGSGELLVADNQNKNLKRFSLQGEFKGTVPVPSGVAPVSVATVGSKVAFTAGSCLYLLNAEGELVWQKALGQGQASHAVAALGGDRVAVCVAGQLEVYDLEGRLLEKIVPEGSAERCLVFLANHKDGFVGSDWYHRSVVLFTRTGQLVAECSEEQLGECQPGGVCADVMGIIYVVLRELNKVVAFSPRGEKLGAFLAAKNSINRPRVVTVVGKRRFAVALSNGTVHIFRIRYQGK